MFRSIRWTLQMWHAAILATVLIVFGWVVFYLVRVTTYQHIDDGLHRMADLVAAGLRPVFARGPNDRTPGHQTRAAEGLPRKERRPRSAKRPRKASPRGRPPRKPRPTAPAWQSKRVADMRPDTADSKIRPQTAQTDPVFPPGFGGRRGRARRAAVGAQRRVSRGSSRKNSARRPTSWSGGATDTSG